VLSRPNPVAPTPEGAPRGGGLMRTPACAQPPSRRSIYPPPAGWKCPETAYEFANAPTPEPISRHVPRRRDGGPASMSRTKITSLDRRLYAWLGESDDKKFERAFNAYFLVAFPAVVRHLMRVSRWDPAQLEELAQDALLRFFERVGRGRREAAGAVQQALTRVRPMNLGLFHERQVHHWTRDVSSFLDSAVRFQLPPADEPNDGNWKAAICALADRIPALSQQGCHILNAVRIELRWECVDEASTEITPGYADEHIPGSFDGQIDHDAAERYALAKAFANAIATEGAAPKGRAQAALNHHPRLVEFVDGTFTIVCALPRLRVPTNGYLFEISMTIYLDECKKRGRQKRGGSGTAASSSMEVTAASNEASDLQHPVEMLVLNQQAMGDDADFEPAASITANTNSAGGFPQPAIDPTIQYENEELFEKFFEYLRKPVADAAQACANAVGTRRASAERYKLESLTSKFARTTAVLGLMGEGHTQDEIAEQLDISRNQVKYVIELVQEAYARFAADSCRNSSRVSHSREKSNAQ
jgi:DNA-directed RNA polymerase specialized sigma24 family protein